MSLEALHGVSFGCSRNSLEVAVRMKLAEHEHQWWILVEEQIRPGQLAGGKMDGLPFPLALVAPVELHMGDWCRVVLETGELLEIRRAEQTVWLCAAGLTASVN